MSHLKQCQVLPGRHAQEESRLHSLPAKNLVSSQNDCFWYSLSLQAWELAPQKLAWLLHDEGIGKGPSLLNQESRSAAGGETQVVGDTEVADPRAQT